MSLTTGTPSPTSSVGLAIGPSVEFGSRWPAQNGCLTRRPLPTVLVPANSHGTQECGGPEHSAGIRTQNTYCSRTNYYELRTIANAFLDMRRDYRWVSPRQPQRQLQCPPSVLGIGA